MKKLTLLLTAAAFLAFGGSAFGSMQSHAASASCKTQLKTLGATGFAALYTTTGECISDMSKLSATERQAVLNAEKTCRAAQSANATAFEAKYGTTSKTTGKNSKTASAEKAFGKCVSGTASA